MPCGSTATNASLRRSSRGGPPLVRYVCPSTDDYIGPLCPTHGRGGATPGAASAPAPGRRGHALQTAAGAGVGLTALGVAKYKLNATQRAIGKQGDSDSRGPPTPATNHDRYLENELMGQTPGMFADPRGPSGLDATVEMAVNLGKPPESDAELDTPYTPDTGAGDILRVLSSHHPPHAKIDSLTIHQNKKVRAFASDPNNNGLLRTVATHRAGAGSHNAELRRRYGAFVP